jgi:hypothetical protein
MNSSVLLYPAIVIFSLLVFGLIFTVMEFSKLQNDATKTKSGDE